MKYLKFDALYETKPKINLNLKKEQFFNNSKEIVNELKQIKGTVIFEVYPGVDINKLNENIIKPLNANLVINIEDYSKSEEELDQILAYNLTDDRVFGIYSHHKIKDFYHENQLEIVKKSLSEVDGLKVVYGFGASQIDGDVLVQVSITRWEIQLRFRAGATNFKKQNHHEDTLRKYKRGFFIEWRVADRIKESIYDKTNYIIDYNDLDNPTMIHFETYKEALIRLGNQPFRMVPYFDPGVWGGQWMKEVCNLDKTKENFAWSFDGVPEENSIKFLVGDGVFEIPAQDLVILNPYGFVGRRVVGRFGKHFPIRYDLLDTYDGGNLSLQVHPLAPYIQDNFGMVYTQDESYYILDTEEDGVVYLGFKNDVDQKAFEKDLIASETTGKFDAEKYVNTFKVNKHDHISIPSGTIHCSGRNTMVLEISACVYIFTFKLWDWGRLGLDGRPRPIHINHGLNNLIYERNYDYAKKHLINPFVEVSPNITRTGLDELHFLETLRYTFTDKILIEKDNTAHMANLVEGQACIIESVDGSFLPYQVNYAETFLIPAGVKEFYIKPLNKNETCMIVKSHVK